MNFKLRSKLKGSSARVGVLKTTHGVVHTPFFMPIATKGAVKGLETRDVEALGAEIILSNTYHLYLQPGMSLIQKVGGLHRFMQTSIPILTDSGGFQVFSLAKLRNVDDDGVTFQSHIDGSSHRLTPEQSIEIQAALGSDIMMALDYFPGYPATERETARAVALTTAWAKRCIEHKKKLEKKNPSVKKQLLFGIVQGSVFRKLRERSAAEIIALPFDGCAVGGLAVGEPVKEMYKVLEYTVPLLPENKLRYLMGVGYPEQIVESVKRGIDMFDCVIPTREGRHGRLFVWRNRRGKRGLGKGFYDVLNIRNAQYRADTTPVNDGALKTYSKAYLHHLFRTGDTLAQRMGTLNNLEFYISLMTEIRSAVQSGKL